MPLFSDLLLSAVLEIGGVEAILLLTSEGIISDYIPSPKTAPIVDRKNQFIHIPLSRLFALPENKTLDELAESLPPLSNEATVKSFFQHKYIYFSKIVPEDIESILDFTTTLPYEKLYILKTADGQFFAILRRTGIALLPTVIKKLQQNTVWLNDDGSIIGLSHRLIRALNIPEIEKPEQLINTKIQTLFSKNPLSEFIPSSEELLELSTVNWARVSEPTFKKPPFTVAFTDSQNLFRFETPFDCASQDFKAVIELECRSGKLPGFIFQGAEGSEPHFPDHCGYLFIQESESDRFVLKKIGTPFWVGIAEHFQTPGTFVLEIQRKGILLSYSVNGKTVLSVRDPSMIQSRRAFQYLYSRKPQEIVVKKTEFFSLPHSFDDSRNRIEVALKNHPNRFFAFEKVPEDNKVIPSGSHWLALYDITDFRQSLNKLSQSEQQARIERDYYRTLLKDQNDSEFQGRSSALLRIKKDAQTVAQSNLSVLIEGETGTGKEVLARYIHQHSPWNNGPFIAVDCASLPASLIESELFGHEKGAFTGASETRIGKLEAAQDGTLFLDEIGNLPLTVQAKLLRFLQSKTIYRLGSSVELHIKTRIVCASNIAIQELLEKGLFRSDLFYRLAGMVFRLPPLRQRLEDIPELAKTFIHKHKTDAQSFLPEFSREALQKLMRHNWPGNVRELEQIVQRATLFCKDNIIQAENILLDTQSKFQDKIKAMPHQAPRALRKEHIQELLDKNGWVVKLAAEEAGISRITFFRKMKKFGIVRP